MFFSSVNYCGLGQDHNISYTKMVTLWMWWARIIIARPTCCPKCAAGNIQTMHNNIDVEDPWRIARRLTTAWVTATSTSHIPLTAYSLLKHWPWNNVQFLITLHFHILYCVYHQPDCVCVYDIWFWNYLAGREPILCCKKVSVIPKCDNI